MVTGYRSRPEKSANPLTARESQVLLLSEGKNTLDVASILFISVKTAKSHRSRLIEMCYAIRRGLVEL